MSLDVSWGASLGTQLLAEISLLEANANNSASEPADGEVSAILCSNSTSIVVGSDHSNPEENSARITSNQSLTSSQNNQLSVGTNASASISNAGLLGSEASEPSEQKIGSFSSCEKRTSLLSVSVHSPLSCSTPVSNPALNLRRASLRSSSILKLQLQNWGLPQAVVQKYAEKKITTLFPWQVECLQTGKVLGGSNLIYSAPTSSGKTLVSELLMLKTVIEQKRKGNISNINRIP